MELLSLGVFRSYSVVECRQVHRYVIYLDSLVISGGHNFYYDWYILLFETLFMCCCLYWPGNATEIFNLNATFVVNKRKMNKRP